MQTEARGQAVLVVDDDPGVSDVLVSYLERAGYQVTTANSGQTALECARGRTFDLFLLDLGLPDMDGLAVLSELRTTTNAPTLVITSRSSEDSRLVGLDQGADDYVIKPFSL
jgi:two-component system KDP operon response regulator KdpE